MKKHPKQMSFWTRHPRVTRIGLPVTAVAIAIGLSWWISRPAPRTPITQLTSLPGNNLGPAGVLCGVAGAPRDTPPIDSPFGLHLYANTPRGVVTQLPAMAIADTLMPPPGAATPAPAASPGTPDKVAAPPPPRNDTALDDVEAVSQILEEYRRAFGAMPVGEQNDEIVRRLQGENPLGIAVLPKSHPSLNSNGELLDRWGTPYRFHPESFWLMTVRSAGPDKRMWSNDDILSTMQEGLASLEGTQ